MYLGGKRHACWPQQQRAPTPGQAPEATGDSQLPASAVLLVPSITTSNVGGGADWSTRHTTKRGSKAAANSKGWCADANECRLSQLRVLPTAAVHDTTRSHGRHTEKNTHTHHARKGSSTATTRLPQKVPSTCTHSLARIQRDASAAAQCQQRSK